MKCQLVRNRILAIAKPVELPDELSAHLDGCSACSTWFRCALLVDNALRSIPVAESDGRAKAAVLAKIRKASKSPMVSEKNEAATKSFGDSPTLPIDSSELATPNHKPMPLSLDEDLSGKRYGTFGHYAAKFWPAGMVAAALLVAAIAWVSLRSGRTQPTPATPADE